MNDQKNHRLSWTGRIGFGLGDLASNLYFQMFNMFLYPLSDNQVKEIEKELEKR